MSWEKLDKVDYSNVISDIASAVASRVLDGAQHHPENSTIKKIQIKCWTPPNTDSKKYSNNLQYSRVAFAVSWDLHDIIMIRSHSPK